jgi:hypothetical protein
VAVKYDHDGQRVWTYTDDSGVLFSANCLSPENDIYLLGSESKTLGTQVRVTKLDSSGSNLWSWSFDYECPPDRECQGYPIGGAVDTSGLLRLVAEEKICFFEDCDVISDQCFEDYLLDIDSTGALIKTRQIGQQECGQYGLYSTEPQMASDGDVWIDNWDWGLCAYGIGSTGGICLIDPDTNLRLHSMGYTLQGDDFIYVNETIDSSGWYINWLDRYAVTGERIWQLDLEGNSRGFELLSDSTGAAIAAGYEEESRTFIVVKNDSDGNQLWTANVPGWVGDDDDTCPDDDTWLDDDTFSNDDTTPDDDTFPDDDATIDDDSMPDDNNSSDDDSSSGCGC